MSNREATGPGAAPSATANAPMDPGPTAADRSRCLSSRGDLGRGVRVLKAHSERSSGIVACRRKDPWDARSVPMDLRSRVATIVAVSVIPAVLLYGTELPAGSAAAGEPDPVASGPAIIGPACASTPEHRHTVRMIIDGQSTSPAMVVLGVAPEIPVNFPMRTSRARSWRSPRLGLTT